MLRNLQNQNNNHTTVKATNALYNAQYSHSQPVHGTIGYQQYGLLSITFDPASIGVVPNLFVFGIA